MNSDKVVLTYKSLAKVERAFRSLKSIDLHIRPIRHWNDDRIRAHVFLCMLAYHVEWHMRDALREIIFDDAEIAGAQASRKSVVANAKRSSSAKQKDATRLTPEGLPVQSFQDLLKDIGTLCRNRIHGGSLFDCGFKFGLENHRASVQLSSKQRLNQVLPNSG